MVEKGRVNNFVCAGFQALTKMLNVYYKKTPSPLFTKEQISNVFLNSTDKFLHSYGMNFPDSTRISTYSKVEAKMLRRTRQCGYYTGSEFILDSGGFQIALNRFKKENIYPFIDMYHNFLIDNQDLYDKAFVLDVTPAPGCEVFSNFNDVYKFNKNTYEIASKLPEEVKSKIVYIHHCRTPKMWEIFTKLMIEEEMFNQFQYYATGGMVASMTSDIQIPCVVYVLPLVPLLNECKKYGRSTLNYHILGGATYRDILFYEFFKIHVKKFHNIDLNITYDSSGVFKNLLVGRHFMVFDKETKSLNRVSIRSENIESRYKGKNKIKDIIKIELDDISERYGINKIQTNDIYDKDTDKIVREVQLYLILHVFDTYSKVEKYSEDIVKELYQLYIDGDFETFSEKLFDVTKNLNDEKVTRKQITKTQNFVKSLDMLRDLDNDYCKYIVDTLLVKDECDLTRNITF